MPLPQVTKKELQRALVELGFEAPAAVVSSLFATFDRDGGGTIEYKELHRAIRREADTLTYRAAPLAAPPAASDELAASAAPVVTRAAPATVDILLRADGRLAVRIGVSRAAPATFGVNVRGDGRLGVRTEVVRAAPATFEMEVGVDGRLAVRLGVGAATLDALFSDDEEEAYPLDLVSRRRKMHAKQTAPKPARVGIAIGVNEDGKVRLSYTIDTAEPSTSTPLAGATPAPAMRARAQSKKKNGSDGKAKAQVSSNANLQRARLMAAMMAARGISSPAPLPAVAKAARVTLGFEVGVGGNVKALLVADEDESLASAPVAGSPVSKRSPVGGPPRLKISSDGQVGLQTSTASKRAMLRAAVLAGRLSTAAMVARGDDDAAVAAAPLLDEMAAFPPPASLARPSPLRAKDKLRAAMFVARLGQSASSPTLAMPDDTVRAMTAPLDAARLLAPPTQQQHPPAAAINMPPVRDPAGRGRAKLKAAALRVKDAAAMRSEAQRVTGSGFAAEALAQYGVSVRTRRSLGGAIRRQTISRGAEQEKVHAVETHLPKNTTDAQQLKADHTPSARTAISSDRDRLFTAPTALEPKSAPTPDRDEPIVPMLPLLPSALPMAWAASSNLPHFDHTESTTRPMSKTPLYGERMKTYGGVWSRQTGPTLQFFSPSRGLAKVDPNFGASLSRHGLQSASSPNLTASQVARYMRPPSRGRMEYNEPVSWLG